MTRLLTLLLLSVVALSCANHSDQSSIQSGAAEPATVAAPAPEPDQAVAIFAGGCFWCMEKPFDVLEGVLSTESGYTGGPEKSPSYKQVSSALTAHIEAIRVLYDPAQISYEQLLSVFWRNIDPTQSGGQFCDRGPQYRSAIFHGSEEEKRLAEASLQEVQQQLKAPVVTELRSAETFWFAEDYHQDYYQKNPMHYEAYRLGCGRDRRLEELWGSGGR